MSQSVISMRVVILDFPANSVFFTKLLNNIRQFGHGWPGGNDEHGENGHSGYLGYITIKNH